MVKIGTQPLSISDLERILFTNESIETKQSVLDKVESSYNFLLDFSNDKVIYGVNTGFGPMAQYKISDNDRKSLQYNLIRSHSAGAGDPIPAMYAKSAMIARLNSVCQGYSGINSQVISVLTAFVNNNVTPYIPEHGGVGASGDLVQLSHLALNLIGEGEVFYNGEKRDAADVFKILNIEPVELHIREGLSLINGTSVMTGIGIVNLLYAKRALSWSILASTMIIEMVESFDDHFSEQLNGVKHHPGQQKIAKIMRNLVSDSKLIRNRADVLYDKEKIDVSVFEDKVQEYYSLRCVPQILGPVVDTLDNAEKVLIDEINSVSDNPIVHKEDNFVYHGGNFHGDYISLEMDKLKIVTTKMTMLAERQLNYLLNHKLNGKLPPFVNLGTLGLNLGMQGCQFTATSTTAESQTLSNPMYVHSIPNNNDNQDIVSMGTNSALLAKKVVDNSFQVMAIQLMTIIQAVDYLGVADKLSSTSKEAYYKLRELVPVFSEDYIKYKEIESVRAFINNNNAFNL